MEDKKLRILQAIDTFYPTIDGAINVVKFYAEELNKTDKCSVIAPNPERKSRYQDNEKFNVIRCKSIKGPENYRGALPSFDKKLCKILTAENFDIIHAHSPFTMGKYCVHFGKKHKIPVVLTLHTRYKADFIRALKGFKPLVNFMMRFIMRTFNKADSVWTVSYDARKILREYGYKGDIQVVRNGTDFIYPENAEELIEKVNVLNGLKDKKNVFVFVGRIAKYKNIYLLADALKILKDKGVDFTMLMVGGGFDEKEFRKKIEELHLSDRFVFTGAIKDRTLLQGYYLRSDLLLFPSTFDVCSLAVIESAAHKVPALVIKGSSSAENIVDNENGFLAEENAESIAEKIVFALSNEKILKNAGENAYRSLYRTWDDVAKEVKEKYVKVIKEYRQKYL